MQARDDDKFIAGQSFKPSKKVQDVGDTDEIQNIKFCATHHYTQSTQ